MSRDLVVVTGEPLWPPVHGGRIRASRIVEELARRFDTRVVAPVEGDPPPGILVDALPPARRGRALTARPQLGHALLGPRRVDVVRTVVARDRPGAVLFTHSYLAAMVPDLGVSAVVDCQDIEARRMSMFSRTGWEAWKARRWEPGVARRAAVVAATCAADAWVLASWGANAVVVPNGADRFDAGPSPADGPVTLVASFGYPPNRAAARFVVNEVWPRLQPADDTVRLRIAGRRAAEAMGWTGWRGRIEVVSDPPSMDAIYEQASVVLVPVVSGGGAQLKVTEALARGRTLVVTPFSLASVPEKARPAVRVAGDAEGFASQVLASWRDAPARWARERSLDRAALPTWAEACAPLVRALAEVAAAS